MTAMAARPVAKVGVVRVYGSLVQFATETWWFVRRAMVKANSVNNHDADWVSLRMLFVLGDGTRVIICWQAW
jgi:hypothetical protein